MKQACPSVLRQTPHSLSSVALFHPKRGGTVGGTSRRGPLIYYAPGTCGNSLKLVLLIMARTASTAQTTYSSARFTRRPFMYEHGSVLGHGTYGFACLGLESKLFWVLHA